jgi:hypothetical protein
VCLGDYGESIGSAGGADREAANRSPGKGWVWLTGLFVAELLILRELQGAIRVIAFFAVIVGFWLAARGRTPIEEC